MTKSVFKDAMKMTMAVGLTQMIFGVLIIICLGMIVGGVLAIRKARRISPKKEEMKDLWLTIGWASIILGLTPLILFMMPQLLIGFGRSSGRVFARMAMEQLF